MLGLILKNLPRDKAIEEHRKMWNWIADECLRKMCCVGPRDYFKAVKTDYPIPRHYESFLCVYTDQQTRLKFGRFHSGKKCEFCPLDWGNGEMILTNTCAFSYLFNNWRTIIQANYDYEKASQIARAIANLPEKKEG